MIRLTEATLLAASIESLRRLALFLNVQPAYSTGSYRVSLVRAIVQAEGRLAVGLPCEERSPLRRQQARNRAAKQAQGR